MKKAKPTTIKTKNMKNIEKLYRRKYELEHKVKNERCISHKVKKSMRREKEK